MNNLPILLFDDSCGLCHWLVRFVIRHDSSRQFRFAALGSSAGEILLQRYLGNSFADTVVLIDDEQAVVRSDAVVRIFRRIGWPWRLLAVASILPRKWRDRGYDAFAARRSRLSSRFGLGCPLPTIEERTRFLDASDLPGVPEVK